MGARASSGVQYWIAEAGDAGRRIDNFLIARLAGVPKSRIYRMLRSGELRVNGHRIKQHYRLAEGDRLRIPPVSLPERGAATAPERMLESINAAIIYEHDHFLVIDKPSGLSVHGGTGIDCGIIEALRQLRPAAPYLELVHRLDRDTSGCLLVAKTPQALRSLHDALRSRDVHKEYLALLAGAWRDGTVTVDQPLRRDIVRGGERRVEARADGRAAVTHFTPVQSFAEATLVSVTLETGRTHQIRAHAAGIGHAIAGDTRYGDRQFNKWCRSHGLKRMFLHAARLSFVTAETGPHDIRAPLPAELKTILEALNPC